MYSPAIVERNIRSISDSLGISLVRYDDNLVEDMTDHLVKLVKSYDKEGRPDQWVRPPNKQEQAYIDNERILCKYDFRYWANRYGYLELAPIEGKPASGVGRLGTVGFMRPQEILLEKLAKSEEEMYEAADRGHLVDGLRYFINKGRQLHFCLAAGAKVLTADMKWLPIEEVQEGQKLISVDECAPGEYKSRRLRTAVVNATLSMPARTTFKLTMDDGSYFTATDNHKFLCKWGAKSQVMWRTVENMRVGDLVRRVCLFEDQPSTNEDGWFGGLLDGEGSLSKTKGSMRVTVSQVAGPVLARAKKYLIDNGYTFSERIDSRQGKYSKLGKKPVHTLVLMRTDEILRLLIRTKPIRWSHEWWEGIEIPRCTSSGKWSRVTKIEDAGIQTVYDIETSTHTYIVNGLATHNTAICRLLSNHRVLFWPDTLAIAASVNEDMTGELYRRDKVLFDNLPWFLKPQVEYDTKNQQFSFSPLGSQTLYHQANQHGGMGMGRMVPVAHMTECAFWDDMVGPNTLLRKLDYHLRAAIPQSLNTLYLLESTSNGIGGWWYDQIELIRQKKSTFQLFFCPFYAANRKYRRYPPDDWNPNEYTQSVAERVERTSPEYFNGRTVRLDREQMYWYETELESMSGRLAVFFSNYPVDLEEAFQSFQGCAFDPSLIMDLRKGIGALYGPYDITTAA